MEKDQEFMAETVGASVRNKPYVLMFGPGVKGGITGVVNDWVEAGITDSIHMEYVSTLNESTSSKLAKLKDAVVACYRLVEKSFGSIDIVHIHLAGDMSFYRKLIIFMLAKLFKIKTIVHLHGSVFMDFYHSDGNTQKKLIRFMFDKADAILVLSEAWKSFVAGISSNEHIHILYNGSSVNKFGPKRNEETDRVTILFMGRLGDRKGVYDLLEAFRRLSIKVPQAMLMLGGDGDVDKVMRLIEQMDLSECIKVLGWVSGQRKIDLYRAADIYALPSYNEGLPVSILEAMASGTPIVSTPVGGIAEAVIEGKNGYLIQPGDVDALYNCLLELCLDRELRVSMGRESRRLIETKFNLEIIVPQLINVYEMTLAH